MKSVLQYKQIITIIVNGTQIPKSMEPQHCVGEQSHNLSQSGVYIRFHFQSSSMSCILFQVKQVGWQHTSWSQKHSDDDPGDALCIIYENHMCS